MAWNSEHYKTVCGIDSSYMFAKATAFLIRFEIDECHTFTTFKLKKKKKKKKITIHVWLSIKRLQNVNWLANLMQLKQNILMLFQYLLRNIRPIRYTCN